MDHAEALEYLDAFADHERMRSFEYPEAFKLDRMRVLLKEFGNPQNAYESVIIAGSKGKGSTAVILSSVLRMENLRVGLYTSPHLEELNERIQMNGLPISSPRLVEDVMLLRRLLDSASWRRDPPTYFEVLTALAFHHFKQMKAHVAVLEVGLGGLYDSTNVAASKVAGLAPVSLEHTDKLGRTVAKIAVQKAGIIKSRQIVVSAPQIPEVEAVFQKAAAQNEATLWSVGREIRIFERDHGPEHQRFDLKGPFGEYRALELRLLGRHQIDNAAVAVGMAKALEERARLRVSEAAVRRGVLDARWPGRLEKMSARPDLVLDGAQNPESARKLVLALKRHFHYEKLFLVLGVSSDKDLTGILAELLPETAVLVATRSSSPRAVPPAEILAAAEDFSGPKQAADGSGDALRAALRLAGPEDLVLVTGSLYLVGEARTFVRKEGV